MSENEQNRNNANDTLVMFCKVVVVIVFVYPLLHYTVLNKGHDPADNEQTENKSELPINDTQEQVETIEIKERIIIQQPGCPVSYLIVILQDLCLDLKVQHSQCTPEDFHNLEKHKLPRNTAKNNTSEPRGTLVGCVAAGLLLTSLGAAFLELYKAKSNTPAKNTKPTISRKCSLADLTVLKHNRKELVRRESIMEIPETGGPSKQLGFRPPPLYRRCSFPVGPTEITCGNAYGIYQESRRSSIESRRFSIIDSRRGSICVEQRKASMVVDNESPERRHWSRLVHRH